jgi:hypothetical protein
MSEDYSVFGQDVISRAYTLSDLMTAIRADVGLDVPDKMALIQQIQGLVGNAQLSTPLSELMYSGLGGVLGFLISKYFSMSPVGQLMSSLAGAGLGRTLQGHLNKPKPRFPGWTMLE